MRKRKMIEIRRNFCIKENKIKSEKEYKVGE